MPGHNPAQTHRALLAAVVLAAVHALAPVESASGTGATASRVGRGDGPGHVYVVTSTTDPGDGQIADGSVTLREAVELANASPEDDEIRFDIPGAGPHTISLGQALPPVVGTVVVDGWSQPGAAGWPLLVIRPLVGTKPAGAFDGLVLAGRSSVLRGVSVVGFGRHGIVLAGEGGHLVEGCYVGLGPDGISPAGSSGDGVLIKSSGNLIGGTSDVAPFAGNVIAANGGSGIRILSGSWNRLVGNRIGTSSEGTAELGNAGCGVLIASGERNVVGGTAKGAGNRIAFNGDAGVRSLTAAGTSILQNSIERNGGLGVDIGERGTGDLKMGGAVTAPTITSVRYGARFAVAEGSLEGAAPKSEYRLEFFASTSPDDSGFGEGAALCTATLVRTDESGRATFRVVFPEPPPGDYISATSTDSEGTTSEFSVWVVATRSGR